MKKWKKGDLKKGKKPPIRIQERIDQMLLSSGEEPEYGTIVESKFKPSRGAKKGEKFYTFSDRKQVESIYSGLKEHLPEMESGKSYNVGYSKDVRSGKSKFVNPGVIGMGRYQVGKGEDEIGKYMSIYDKWDLDPSGGFVNKVGDWAMPGFEMYDRRYYDFKQSIPEQSDIRRAPPPEFAAPQPVPTGQLPTGANKVSIDDKIMNFLHKMI